MTQKFTGLHIIPEEQSDNNLFKMLLLGDGFIAHLISEGKDTDELLTFRITKIERLEGRRARFHIFIMNGNEKAGINNVGPFQLIFDPSLRCYELPPEMFEP